MAVKNHRRQVSHGLEINTTKTNAFFNTADIPTPRPPPSISRKISIKQHHTNTSHSISPPSPSILTNTLEEEEDNLYHHDSYANRLRHLVASSRQSPLAPAPSPIPQHLNAKKVLHHHNSPSSPLKSAVYDDNETMVIDEILSLPTPHPQTSTSSTTTKQQQRHFIFPTNTTHDPIIPVLSFNILQTSEPSTIPRLSENLKLGDDQDILMTHGSTRVQDLDLVGNQIGSYRICKLLGVGAFSHVYLASHVDSNVLFAIKVMQKGKLLDDPRVRSSIEREVGVLKVRKCESMIYFFIYICNL